MSRSHVRSPTPSAKVTFRLKAPLPGSIQATLPSEPTPRSRRALTLPVSYAPIRTALAAGWVLELVPSHRTDGMLSSAHPGLQTLRSRRYQRGPGGQVRNSSLSFLAWSEHLVKLREADLGQLKLGD